jgi:hypothetical protein
MWKKNIENEYPTAMITHVHIACSVRRVVRARHAPLFAERV